MTPNHADRLISVIIPCWNQLEFTRQCLRALFRYTRRPIELIVIDNGSADATPGYLSGVQDAAPVPVTVVSNARNFGFPAACNQGLRLARGEYLVLLNNDVVVTDAWLDQLVALAEMDTGGALTAEHTETTEAGIEGGKKGKEVIGLVGPMSNYASPPQLVENVPYADMEQMQAFALRWRNEHRGQWFTAGKLSGLCLLMKRSVYEKIGGLDERFGMGFFDDDDLAVRAQRAGFSLAVAHDLFIHHFGSRTFAGAGIDTERLLQENGRRFAEKWGMPSGNGQPVKLAPWTGRLTQRGHSYSSRSTRSSGKTQWRSVLKEAVAAVGLGVEGCIQGPEDRQSRSSGSQCRRDDLAAMIAESPPHPLRSSGH
jgi:GT2 family glycosyltransferase